MSKKHVDNIMKVVRPAAQAIKETDTDLDQTFMIVFGGKSAVTDQVFNDLNILAFP